MPTPKIDIPMDRLADFCRRWKIVELSLFGSVLRDDFGPESDVDVLVTFDPSAEISTFDMVSMRAELVELFGRRVDLLTHRAIRESGNPYKIEAILGRAHTVYAA